MASRLADVRDWCAGSRPWTNAIVGQNILGFTLLRLWTIVCKVFAQELTYFTYLSVLRKTPEVRLSFGAGSVLTSLEVRS